jgi:exodeoxyribonuclease III
MKIITYNVNGIRSASSKGLREYIAESQADFVCFQELKALPEQIDAAEFESLGYQCYWFSAQKKGYSGVGIITKHAPLKVVNGCEHELYDSEGRVMRLDYSWGSVISAYFPSGTSGDERQNVKMDFLNHFFDHIQDLRKLIPNLVVCGDYNICHQAIDIHDPVSNKNSTGFLPEERDWMSKWFDSGFTDSFRSLHEGEAHNYTWWSFRANARANNKGWRIDYISVSGDLNIADSGIDPSAKHSDHCPSWVKLVV